MAVTPEYLLSGLVKRGVPRNAALGFVGNFQIESRLDPSINEIAPLVKGSRGGFGLAQWTGPRRRQLEAFAGSQGRDVADPELQMDFLAWELGNTERGAAEAIYAAQTPEEAARAVSESFLRPGIPHLDARINATREIAGLSGGDGVAAVAGGSGEDDLSGLAEWAGLPVTQQQPAPEQPAQMTPAQAYASTGALDVGDIGGLAEWAGLVAPTQANPDMYSQVGELQGPNAAYYAQEPAGQPQAQPPTFFEEFQRGLGLGARDVAEGLYSIPGIILNAAGAVSNAATGRNMPLPTQQFSEALPLPRPQTATERVLSSIQQGAISSLGGVGLARGAESVLTGTGQAVARDLASNVPAQIAGGMGAGAGAQTAAEMGAGPGGQFAAALGGALLGGQIPAMRPTVSATARADIEAGRAAGVPVMTSDIAPPETFIGRNAQRIGEMIPVVGTGGVRAAQQRSRVDAIRDWAIGIGAASGVVDDVMKSLSETRSAFISKYNVLKRDVIESIPGKVPTPNAIKAIDDQIASLSSMRTAGVQPVIAKLKDWRRAIQDQDLVNIEAIRSQMGEAFSDPNLAAIRGVGEKALRAIYGPLREDMGAFIKANGAPRDVTKWGVANARLRDGIEELNVTALNTALKKGDTTPEAVKNLLLSSKPSDVRTLFRNLSEEGRARARAAIAQDVLERATVGDEISPAKFLTELQKRANSVGVFFAGRDLQAIKGLERAVRITRRAGDAAVSPATGIQAVPVVGAAALTQFLGTAGAALAAGAGYGLGSRAFESKFVRNILVAIGKTKPGSADEARMIKRLSEAARAASATEKPE